MLRLVLVGLLLMATCSILNPLHRPLSLAVTTRDNQQIPAPSSTLPLVPLANPAADTENPANINQPAAFPAGLYPIWLASQQASTGPEYAIAHMASGAWKANNPAHSLQTVFSEEGLKLNGTWSLALSGIGYQGQPLQQLGTTVAPQATGANRIEYQRQAGLVEWYVNGPLGLEQGFTISQSLPRQPEEGWLELGISLQGATARPTRQGDWVTINPDKGPVLRYGQLYAYDADGVALPSRLEITSDGKGLRLLTDVKNAHFPVTVDPFIQEQLLTASNGATNNIFGFSVALNNTGDIALVGAYRANSDHGAAYVFSRNGAVWSQQQVLSDTTTAGSDNFGFSVALNSAGDVALIGAQNKTETVLAQGAAYVFTRNGSVWSQQQVLSDTVTGGSFDFFGDSVALNSAGDVALIGALNKTINGNPHQGAAYIFNRSGGVWSQQQVLSDTTTVTFGDVFGNSVVLNTAGDTAFIGAPGKTIGSNSNQGAVYVFNRSGAVWNKQQVITDTTGIADDHLGVSIALNGTGDTLLIGANGKTVPGNTSRGAVFVFNRSGVTWSQQQILSDNTNGTINDNFGNSVALNSTGDIALIGASNKTVVTDQGAVYLFIRSGGVWSKQQVFSDTNGASGDYFGISVALSGAGDTAFIGDGYKKIGANTAQGAVFVFQSSIVSLTNAPNPSVVGQSVTFTATVSPVAATGTVTFTEGANILGTSTLSNGIATFSTNGLPIGSHVISSTYGGDSNYPGNTSNTVIQVVNPPCSNPKLVTNITDNGAGTECGSFSLAIAQPPGITVTFALTQGNTITFTGSLTRTVNTGVTIDGGVAGIVLYGNGVAGDGLQLQGNDTLINLTIRKFAGRELVTLGPGNKLQHVVIQQT
jgi:hypothetical protein